MKVVYVTSHLAVGGAEKILFKQCQLFRKHGFEVSIVCTDIIGNLSKALTDCGFSISDISPLRLRGRKNRALINILDDIKPDLVYISNARVEGAIAFSKKKLHYKVITQVHGCLERTNGFSSELLSSYGNDFDGVICPHPKTYELLRSKYNCKLLLNPIGREFFETEFSPRDRTTISFCGRISIEKSLISLAKIAANIKCKIPELTVTIVGDADSHYPQCVEYKQKVLDAFNQANVPLSITGFVDNCHDFMKTACISVLPSVTEGFSNTIWESFAVGVPVVATSVGSAYCLLNPAQIVPLDWLDLPFELRDDVIDRFSEATYSAMTQVFDQNVLRKKALPAHEDLYEPEFMDFVQKTLCQ